MNLTKDLITHLYPQQRLIYSHELGRQGQGIGFHSPAFQDEKNRSVPLQNAFLFTKPFHVAVFILTADLSFCRLLLKVSPREMSQVLFLCSAMASYAQPHSRSCPRCGVIHILTCFPHRCPKEKATRWSLLLARCHQVAHGSRSVNV